MKLFKGFRSTVTTGVLNRKTIKPYTLTMNCIYGGNWVQRKKIGNVNKWYACACVCAFDGHQNVIWFKLCVFRRKKRQTLAWQTFPFNYLIYLYHDLDCLDLLIKIVRACWSKFCCLVIISHKYLLTNNNMQIGKWSVVGHLLFESICMYICIYFVPTMISICNYFRFCI